MRRKSEGEKESKRMKQRKVRFRYSVLRDVSSAVTKYVQRTRQPGFADLVGYKGPLPYLLTVVTLTIGSEAPDKAPPTTP
ncbi:uncharacterized protein BO88DRAFT_407892 [Aspergillus vadensis CBS 113365]|uniref:Uncharacterized protein n=1 Tax=Aspergillus vadensis (strain CBS 113365 / IMI 142717 / IBT 24658) TaxID=1448311 RepID=A0A319BPX8_ASPVC|nr:hypothetical protein BO88DRAFT_407892 [Aspergillus vadensis CBS 113365]PYH65268.1 hypothetical protein BO88DRAFT_407892 [Aspergillus vadensis CBS 113365]